METTSEMSSRLQESLYEPAARERHASFSVEGKLYVWGGVTKDSSRVKDDTELTSSVEQFDPYLEEWSRLNTTGPPHTVVDGSASTSFEERVYMYGKDVLSCLDLSTLTWSRLSGPGGTAGGPMRKTACGIVHFRHDRLAVIGGFGHPTGPIQSGSPLIRATRASNVRRGWTNEIYVFDISNGVWLSPSIRGTRPPPCIYFTLTRIDNHRAVLFGGYQPERGRVSDLYLIDFDSMEMTQVEPSEGEPWPAERSGHAACCLGCAGGHIHLLVTGGRDKGDKILKDIWLFNLSSQKWKEVSLLNDSLRLPRMYHSATAITLCPELIEVVEFGGYSESDAGSSIIADTTIITFSRIDSEWVIVGMSNKLSQWGTNDRIRQKMVQISEKIRVIADNGGATSKSSSLQANEREVQERVAAAVKEERMRAKEAERRLQESSMEAETKLQDLKVILGEEREALEEQLHQAEERAQEAERRLLDLHSQQESHWLVQRKEIELMEEERGRGGWAAVKVANFRGTRVAAKCFYQQILVSHYNRQLFNREMNMAARLRHPNLIQFIGASLEGEPIILTELMTTSLRAELEKGPIEHAHITSISLDVARALNYLHLMQPHPIIHRDISSANVLLDLLPGNGWKAKVSDYGSVNLLRELRTVGPGSPVYAAPEASIPAEQSPKMDIFSFGVLLIEMLTDAFPAVDARQLLLSTIDHTGFKNLIRRCLREQKEKRPSANDIISNIQDM